MASPARGTAANAIPPQLVAMLITIAATTTATKTTISVSVGRTNLFVPDTVADRSRACVHRSLARYHP